MVCTVTTRGTAETVLWRLISGLGSTAPAARGGLTVAMAASVLATAATPLGCNATGKSEGGVLEVRCSVANELNGVADREAGRAS